MAALDLSSFHVTTQRVTGYSSENAEKCIDRITQGGPVHDYGGDFIFAFDGTTATNDGSSAPSVLLVASAVAAHPYYYHASKKGFWHGANIYDVAEKAGLPWCWNHRAVRSLALMEHTLGEDTLHADIRRVRPSSLYLFEDGKLHVETLAGEPDEGGTMGEAIVERVIECLRKSVSRLGTGRPVAVSLSAGFDSRATLALCLNAGIRPVLGTMGAAEATDRKVASSIAASFGLEHHVTEILPDSYLSEGTQIAHATSGTKSMAHWHTWFFAKQIGFPKDALHLIGANGEQVRSYFFDEGLAAQLAEFAPNIGAKALMRLKYSPRRRLGKSVDTLPSPLGRQDFGDVIGKISVALDEETGMMRALDHFYTFERVRHFIGNGLAVCSEFQNTASVFLDATFVRLARRMPRRWMLDNAFHKELIRRCEPRLLEFPTDDSDVPAGKVSSSFYWMKKRRETSYNPVGVVILSPRFRELILDSPHLDWLVARADRERIFTSGTRQFLLFLATMHFATEAIPANLRRDS